MLLFSGCGAKKFRIDYDGMKDCFTDAKDEYGAGEKVTVYYDLIATDTDYSFYVDGERMNCLYTDGKGYEISFIMPEHDVKVTVEQKNSMIYIPPTESGFEKNPTLTFDSFDGGGPEYTVEIEDTEILSCSSERRYDKPNHEELTGSGYDVILTFTGLMPGDTVVTVRGESPIVPEEEHVYDVIVDEELNVSLTERE